MAFSLAVTALALGATYVKAQSSNVTCSVSGYAPLSNSIGQNPCLMGAYARGECVGGAFTMNSIAPQTHYIPNAANPCECSALVYNLVSACGLCQGRIIINFNLWVQGCSGTNGPYAGYPEAIPPGTAFPNWAYLDPSKTNNFTLSAALAAIGSNYPESTPVPQSLATGGISSTASSSFAFSQSSAAAGTGSITGGSSSRAFSFSNPTNTANPGDNSNGGGGGGGSTSNAGAIAGGVVGGLVGLGIIVGLITWLLLRKRRQNAHTAPSTEYGAGAGAGAYGAAGPHTTSTSPVHGTNSMYGSEHQGAPSMGQYSQGNNAAFKPYNPSDPSTYPVSPGTPTIQTTQQPGYGGGHDAYGGNRAPAPGQYSGVAEL